MTQIPTPAPTRVEGGRPPDAARSATGPARRTGWQTPGLTARSYLYLLPGILLVGGVLYFSIGYTVWLSTLDWDGISPIRTFVGISNYVDALTDPIFWSTLLHSLIFSATIVIQMALGLFLAVLLRSGIRLSGVYKVLVFIPTILAPAVMAPVFRQIFAVDGQLNAVLETVGLGFLAQPWLANPEITLFTLMAVNIWQFTGLSFILYFSGLSQIDTGIYEAARLDGAGNGRVLWSIVVPLMRGTHVTLLILGVIGVLKTFDIVYLITGGGPARSTEFLSTYIYEQAIVRFDAGYGAALSVLLLVLSLTFTVWQMRRYRRSGVM